MIIDITGTELVPGNCGKDCPGSGTALGIECCCDECDYMQCCLKSHKSTDCLICKDKDCPHASTLQEDFYDLPKQKTPPYEDFPARWNIFIVSLLLY